MRGEGLRVSEPPFDGAVGPTRAVHVRLLKQRPASVLKLARLVQAKI